MEEMEQTTEKVLGRMENSLDSLEQMSFDSINITDKLVSGIDGNERGRGERHAGCLRDD